MDVYSCTAAYILLQNTRIDDVCLLMFHVAVYHTAFSNSIHTQTAYAYKLHRLCRSAEDLDGIHRTIRLGNIYLYRPQYRVILQDWHRANRKA